MRRPQKPSPRERSRDTRGKQPPAPKPLKAIERAQEKSALYRIIRLAKRIDERIEERVDERINEEALRRASGGELLGLSRRHLALLSHLGAEGARITALAELLGVTKQAASQTVSELEALGLLERVPDPNDGRAKLVTLTDAGWARILGDLEILLELERELGRGLPRGAMAALRGTLDQLDERLSE